MEDTNTFWGAKRNTIMMVGVTVAICAPALTMIATVIGLFSMMNSSINRLDNNVTALRAELNSELGANLNTLSADIVELKLETTQIRVSVDEIARRMHEIESVDGRLDELEREQARIKERIDALAAE